MKIKKPQLVPVWKVGENQEKADAYLADYITRRLDAMERRGADPTRRIEAGTRARAMTCICPRCMAIYLAEGLNGPTRHECSFTCRRCIHGHKQPEFQPCAECYKPVHWPRNPPTRWYWCEGE